MADLTLRSEQAILIERWPTSFHQRAFVVGSPRRPKPRLRSVGRTPLVGLTAAQTAKLITALTQYFGGPCVSKTSFHLTVLERALTPIVKLLRRVTNIAMQYIKLVKKLGGEHCMTSASLVAPRKGPIGTRTRAWFSTMIRSRVSGQLRLDGHYRIRDCWPRWGSSLRLGLADSLMTAASRSIPTWWSARSARSHCTERMRCSPAPMAAANFGR